MGVKALSAETGPINEQFKFFFASLIAGIITSFSSKPISPFSPA